MSTPRPVWALLLAVLPVPPIALFAPLGMAPLVVLSGLVALAIMWKDAPWRDIPRWPLAALAIAAAWALLSAFWALEPWRAARTATSLFSLAVLGFALMVAASRITPKEIRPLMWAAAGIVVMMALISIFEVATCGTLVEWIFGVTDFCGLGFFVLKRGIVVAAVLAWPAALALWNYAGRFRWLAPLPILAVIAASHEMSAGAAQMSFFLGGAALIAVLVMNRIAIWAMAACVVLVTMAAPLATQFIPEPQALFDENPGIENSAHHRLVIWRFVGSKWREHPIRGWGLEASRELPGSQTRIWVERDWGDRRIRFDEQLLPLHPHNIILQWWLELGLPGILSLIAVFLLTLRAIARLDGSRMDRAAAAATFTSGLFISAVSFGAWQAWWLSSLWLAAALVVSACRKEAT